MSSEEDVLIAAACSAWRPASIDGSIQFHPAWHDLDASGRQKVFDETARLRVMEASLDPEGLSTTSNAVLARIRSA